MTFILVLVLGLSAVARGITISHNGKSAEQFDTSTTTESNYSKSRKLNVTNLSMNERVRRLIPYMTFYYANDAIPYHRQGNSIEVQKMIINTKDLRYPTHSKQNSERNNYVTYRTVPRYKNTRPTHYTPQKHFQSPLRTEQEFMHGHTFGRPQYKDPINWRKPEINFLNSDVHDNIQYYITDPESSQKYKLVPYEQTPPVKVEPEQKILEPIPVPVLSYPFKKSKIHHYEEKVKPITVTETYYQKPQYSEFVTPEKIESGFRPMVPTQEPDTHNIDKLENPIYIKGDNHDLAVILKALQDAKPSSDRVEPIKEISPMDSFVNTVRAPILSTPKPFFKQEENDKVEEKLEYKHYSEEEAVNDEPIQHLEDEYDQGHRYSSSQSFPLNTDDSEGGTPGRPGVDYPTLDAIPETAFDCKTQRYKGFFADPETRCQVWHYCELNGGQASFLCPNGTVFNQAALTCDWWFNVRCASTPQLYVLNERLYKFILPHQPKFPEDFAGPLVDKYLTLKFKEMEEQFRKNKSKQSSTSEAAVTAPTAPAEETSNSLLDHMELVSPTAPAFEDRSSSDPVGVQVHNVGATGNIPPELLLNH